MISGDSRADDQRSHHRYDNLYPLPARMTPAPGPETANPAANRPQRASTPATGTGDPIAPTCATRILVAIAAITGPIRVRPAERAAVLASAAGFKP